MRSLRDALLSLRWYLVDVLAPRPPLLEIRWQSTTWTPIGRGVEGSFEVDERQWAYLVGQFSSAEDLQVDGDLSWVRRTLLADPRPTALVLGMPLPDAAGGAVLTDAHQFLPGEVWEIRESDEPGTLDLPLALVLRIGELGNPGGGKFGADYAQPVEIHCYPVPWETVDESRAAADAVEERLQLGFRLTGAGLGRPLRVPLWDFDGVNPDESESFYRHPSDFLRVSNFTTQQLPEEDQRRIRVIAGMTLGWRRPANLPTGPLTQEVRLVGSGS